MADFATVTEISGRAWVRQPDGSLAELRPGVAIPLQSEIVTAPGASVTLAVDGAAPVTIGGNRSVAITDEFAASVEPDASAISLLNMTDSARLLAALESGEDPFGVLEATAAIAGGPGGDDGGGGFVRLLRILESTTPPDLGGGGLIRAGRTEEDLTRLGGNVPGNDPDTTPPNPPSITLGTPEASGAFHHVEEASGASVSDTFTVTAEAGVSSLLVNGQDITGVTAASPVIISADFGELQITDYDVTSGVVSYIYTETAGAQDHSVVGKDGVRDNINIVVIDQVGQTAGAPLVIQIDDTAPTAKDDTGSITEDETAPATGNVLTGDAGADDLGADDAISPTVVVGIAAGDTASATENVGATSVTIQGQYGTLTINADGSYEYTLDNSLQAVQARDVA